MYVSHTDSPAHAATTGTAAADRANLYVPIHKAIRSMMADTLCRVGRLDTDDVAPFEATLTQLRSLLMLCTKHIEHEEVFVHPAIEARMPAVSDRTASEHVEHLASIAALGLEVVALGAAGSRKRPALALKLYRNLALFIAESIRHFDFEETVNAEALSSHYSQAETTAIHDRLLASLSPGLMSFVLRWAVPAMTPMERVAMFDEMRSKLPPDAFAGIVASVEPHLEPEAWTRLSRAVGAT